MMYKIITILLCLSLLMLPAGCAGVQEPPEDGTEIPDISGSRSITDAAGQVLIIPDNNSQITLATVYAVSVPFISALGLSERTLAVNVKSAFWTQADEGYAGAGNIGRGVVDMEALAGISPDVLIHRSNDIQTVEAVSSRLGIPVLCIEVENYDDIFNTIDMLGIYFDAGQRAEEVSSWLSGKFSLIDDITAKIPHNERKSALVLGSRPYRVAGGDMLQSWMVEKAGGITLAADITNNRNWAGIGLEMVFELNPDVLFCTGSTVLDYRIEQLLQDSTWSAMTAVINEDIHIIPAAIDAWDLPGISAALAVMYMMHIMYPDYFSAQDLQREIDEYYTFMFGRTFDYDYLGIHLG